MAITGAARRWGVDGMSTMKNGPLGSAGGQRVLET